MRRDPQPHDVRVLVIRTFTEFGAPTRQISDLDESILIDDGRYVARSYRASDYMAMWLIELGILQFYDAEGEMLRTVNLFEEMEPQRQRLAA